MKHLPKLLSILLVLGMILTATLVVIPSAEASTTLTLDPTKKFETWEGGTQTTWDAARTAVKPTGSNAEFGNVGTIIDNHVLARFKLTYNFYTIPAGSVITSATIHLSIANDWSSTPMDLYFLDGLTTGPSIAFGNVYGTVTHDTQTTFNYTFANPSLLSKFCGTTAATVWVVSGDDYLNTCNSTVSHYLRTTSYVYPKLDITYSSGGWQPTFTSTPGTTGQVGSSYSYTPTTNETATITAPTLPAWATYSGGTISGTPSAAGTYAFKVHAVGPGTLGADQYWNVTVSAAPVTPTWKPTFTNTPPDTVAFGDGYTYSPACNESVTYDLESFPAWAGLVDGSVIGLPNEVGSYDFSLKATSTAGTLSSWLNWTVEVQDSTPIPAFLTSPVTNASKRVWYSYQPLTDMDCTWTVNSSAGWIVISQYTGQVFGLPTSPGTFHIVITATSVEYGTTATQAFDLTVGDYVMPPDNDIGDGGSDGGDDSGGDSTLDIPERYLLTGLVIVIAFVVVIILASRRH